MHQNSGTRVFAQTTDCFNYCCGREKKRFLLFECLKVMVVLAASRLGSSFFCFCSTPLGLKLISP